MIRLTRFLCFFLAVCLPFGSVAQSRRGEVTVAYQIQDGFCYASINRSGWREPKSVRICAEKELDALPTDASLYRGETAKAAFTLLFSPLKAYLKKGDRIYFSPAGKLYLVNLAALMDDSGHRLFERYHFFRVSDVSALPSDPKKHRYYTIRLYGGMNYEADFDQMNYYGWSCHAFPAMQSFIEDCQGLPLSGISFGQADDGTRAGYGNLKASREEIKFIYRIRTWLSSPNTGPRALEELFRGDTRRDHEYVMHLSTHTFNIPFRTYPGEDEAAYKRKLYKSCGLLFSGAGHTIRGEKMPFGLNDGLLYAEEIAGLDMHYCCLLVLAACNTALGTVTQDGILGLQSAFKEAGAQTLLMTLWSVNDRATAEFMKVFYTHLFDGKNKHESLDRARKALMDSADFNDPVYWAPFIMLD